MPELKVENVADQKHESLTRTKRQRFYGQRYTPQGYDYNYNYPRFENRNRGYPRRQFSNYDSYSYSYERPRFRPSSRAYGFDSPPSYSNYDGGYNGPQHHGGYHRNSQTSIRQHGYYEQNGEYSFRVNPNQFKNNRVPLARPGHLARQGGRKVRPPGVLDDRVLNPRQKNMNQDGKVIEPNYGPDSSSSSEYEHQIDYTYDEDYTQISEDSYDTDNFSGDDDDGQEEPDLNNLISDRDEERPSHPTNPDKTGLPDLVTDPLRVQHTLNVDFQFLHNLTCALEEGCLSPSAYESVGGDSRSNLRKLLRFTQKISNIGNADFISPHHPDDWQWHSCHKHFHSMNVFSKYELISGAAAELHTVASSHKASFCLEDTECLPGRRQKYDCKTEQAISPGCADIYVSGIDCQWIDVTDVPLGHYILRVEVNPSRLVKESDFENNVLNCDVYLSRKQAWAKNCRN